MVRKIKQVMAVCVFFFAVLFVLARLSPETLSLDRELSSFSSSNHFGQNPSLIIEELEDPMVEENELLTLRAKYGPIHHSSSSSCFSAMPASLYPSSDDSIASLSQCDQWWNLKGKDQQKLDSAWECQKSLKTEFGQLCYFENACFANNTIFVMLNEKTMSDLFYVDLGKNFHPFKIFPGVGHVRRNDVRSIEVKGVAPDVVENWLESNSPCLIRKPTFVFARIYNNFFYTTYTAAALDALLRSVDPMYHKNVSGDRVVMLTDRAKVRDTATGFFEMFSPYHYSDTKMISMDDDPARRPLCFAGAYVGLNSGNVVQGDDIKAFLRHRHDTLRKKYNVNSAAILKACVMNKMTDEKEYDPAIENDEAEEAQGSEVQNIDVYQHLNHKEGSIGVETTGALETSPWSEYDEAGFSDVADLQSFFDPRGEDGIEKKKKKKKRGAEVEISTIVAECETTKAVTRSNLKEFSRMLLYKHGLFQRMTNDTIRVTFISRGNNRRILNENQLVETIKMRYGDAFPIDVQLVRLEKLSFHDQLKTIRNTNIIVGMHGAAWVHLLWLDPERSAAIELFPYKVHKATYLILANLLGLDFYQWRNSDPTKSVFNWDIIAHHNLTDAEKAKLIKTGKVRNWSSLYARYFFKNADTIVDEEQFFTLFDKVVEHVSAKLAVAN